MEGGPVHGILGRDAELAEVQSFVGSAPGGPSALLLEGTAGIGKTTLWRAGVSTARARGHRVLSCRAAEAEARLSYAALGDLFDFELPDLPAPQRRALDAALLREEVEGAPPDQRAVSLASLGVLRALAASAPVIIAIDDVQWLDAPSARVLAFVAVVWRMRRSASWWRCAPVPAATRSPWVGQGRRRASTGCPSARCARRR